MKKILLFLVFLLNLLPITLSAQDMYVELDEVVCEADDLILCPRCQARMTAAEWCEHDCGNTDLSHCPFCQRILKEGETCDCRVWECVGDSSGGNSGGTSSGSSGSYNSGRDIINGSSVPSKVLSFLRSLKTGGGKIKITSVKRSVESQARAVLNNIMRTSVKTQYLIYRAPGRKLCAAYRSDLSYEQNLATFINIINSYPDPSVFSHHLGGYDWRCTFDISGVSLENPQKLFEEIQGRTNKHSRNYDSNILKVMFENGCIHIEYKIR